MNVDLNYHLKDGVYFRREGDKIKIVRAKDFEDPGEVLCETDLNGLCSMVSSASPWRETGGSFQYIYDFLKNGVMFCGGCGVKLTPDNNQGVGTLSVINRQVCTSCYKDKFKPLFEWGMAMGEPEKIG